MWKTRALVAGMLFVPALAHAQTALAATASLSGRVLSEPDRAPVANAEVRILDAPLVTRTDSTGAFRLDGVTVGEHMVYVRQLGFVGEGIKLVFEDSVVVAHDFVLARVQTLDTVSVAGKRTSIPEFEDRRKLGIGHFIARAALERQEFRRLSEVLSTLPGLRIFRAPGGEAWVVNGRVGHANLVPDSFSRALGARPACYVDVWLDGTAMYSGGKTTGMLFDINTIPPATLEGVEFYASPAQTPIKYARYDNQCGVLVLWSRQGP